ncbi:MAG TPA: DUF4203 domain-containing protein [bacterium]|nr:DUF4203 domain-containing protein [bacterium]
MRLITTLSPFALLLAGFVVCFFGYRLLRLTLALAGFGVGLVLGLSVARLMPHTSHVFAVVVGVVCGVLFAVLATAVYKFGVFLLGAGAGALLAGVIITAAGWHHPMLIRVIAAMVGGILTLLLERPLVSILSALVGSWGIVFGAAELLKFHHRTAGAGRPSALYGLMIVCWLVLAVIGAGAQLRSDGKHR